MAIVDLVMPKLGESIIEATILKWHKSTGDPVKMDETILDIATDKVDSEIPSGVEGIIEEILFSENEIVPIGSVIARIRVSNENSVNYQPAPESPKIESVQRIAVSSPLRKEQPAGNTHRFYSPLVLNIAVSEGVSMLELESIPGTGNEGRVSKRDMMQYITDRRSAGGSGRSTGNSQRNHTLADDRQFSEIAIISDKTDNTDIQKVPAAFLGNVEIIEMDRMRRMISKHMTDSKNISAHVTSFAEADVTNMVLWRAKVKKEFEKRENEKITFTPLFIEVIVKCIKKYPWLNSSVDGDRLIVKKDINIGMATALPSGNLIVPVIKNADQLNLVGLTRQVNQLANGARSNKLKPDDTADGTFTLTNIGSFGSLMGTPIINQPQVAILAIGAIKKKPVVIETAQGDSIAIRHMMFLSMSYDHRVIDGALGATFLNAVAKELENFSVDREI